MSDAITPEARAELRWCELCLRWEGCHCPQMQARCVVCTPRPCARCRAKQPRSGLGYLAQIARRS